VLAVSETLPPLQNVVELPAVMVGVLTETVLMVVVAELAVHPPV
jgi:hypothetical protein